MLLSICIPTKNRAAVLQKSLQSIVSQDIFTERDDIEIVICDNASDDNTEAVTQEFVDHFKGRIRYYRNANDIEDYNVEKALRYGQGEFLKLANDSLNWLPGSLENIVRLVEMTLPIKPVLFFLNQTRKTEEAISEVGDCDSLLQMISFHITWIGGFGIWKNQLNQLLDFSRHAKLKLPQVDVILRLMSISKVAYVCNLPLFHVISSGRKGGYNIAEVFGTNYLAILRQFQDQISVATMSTLKKEVLEQHILPFFCSDAHDFGQIEIEKHLPDYATEQYFGPMLASAKAQKENAVREKLHQDAPTIWRKRNVHNQTAIRNLFDFDKVSVGQATYGPLNIHEWGHPNERLNIGHYVSISEGVTFLLGGNHPYQGITTFPVKVKFLGHTKEAQTKGAINVGDDVWLGHNALVMSGVTISQGAVIAAGSVVSRDVPPYAIVAGNPARIVKYRFPDQIIQELLKINYSNIRPNHLTELGLDLYESYQTHEFSQALSKLITISNPQFLNTQKKEYDTQLLIQSHYKDAERFNTTKSSKSPSKNSTEILFIGNSITIHSPSHDIGWINNNGMNASEINKNYCHLLINKLKIDQSNSFINNFSEFEKTNIIGSESEAKIKSLYVNLNPKITIIQLGDNISNENQLKFFENNLRIIMDYAKYNDSKIFILSTWWESKKKDKIIKSMAKEFNAEYIYIGDIFEKEKIENKNKNIINYQNSGVQNHPHDWGMQAISDRIYSSILLKINRKA